ncbi:hypothetical protein HHUSO_G16450 [Huso huso]|uniref:Uncharacterized protein n=1 Tax=Huso huso TaxID=61971 RepID=A0ABR0ZBC1_HUSHU
MTSKVQKRIPLDSSLILEANSPANQYLVQLLDDKKELSFQKPTEARMRLLFQVLEDLVPQLGVFSRVVALIRDELYDGVYSLQLTKDPDLESETAEMVTRLPYFSLLRRQQDEQNQKADNLRAELNQNKEILFEKEKDLGKMLQKLEDLGKETESLKHEIVSFEEELKKKNDELLSVQHELTNLTETHTKQASRHEITVSELKSTLQGAQDHISNLNQFKELYDGLQEAFQFPVAKKNKNNLATISPKAPTNRKAVMATKKDHLHSYLKTTRNQEHQLLKVQNSVIADFEACIENHKKWLLSEKFRHSTRREEHEILMKEEEFAEKQNIFQQSMADISAELALLKQHRKSLQEQLNVLEKTLHQDQENEEKARSAQHTTQAPGSRVASGSWGLERGFSTQDDFENAQDDSVQDFFYNAFFPDERALNKYAAMIYNSCSGGKMYEEAKGAAFCNSCGEKTFICPHKVAINCVLELPPNCTHIKITRPWSHIITMEAKLQRKNNDTPTPASAGSSVTSSEPSPINQQTLQTKSAVLEGLTNKSNNDKEQQPLAVLGDCKTQPPQATSSWWGEEEKALINDFSTIWACFKKQLKLKRRLPRIITMDNCLSVTEELIASFLWADGNREDLEPPHSIQDTLCHLINEQYVSEEASCLVISDFLSAVITYAPQNRLIAVLGHTLCGNLDSAVLRYIVVMAELVNCISWKFVRDFNVFASQVYSFLQDDALDLVTMEYTAFSENRISQSLVLEFILNCIVKNSEPMFEEYVTKLRELLKTDSEYISSSEFAEAFENIAPLCNEKLQQTLVQQSLAAQGSDLIPLRSAAQITAYVVQLQQLNIHKTHLSAVFEATRENGGRGINGRVSPKPNDIITMSKVTFLACNIAR